MNIDGKKEFLKNHEQPYMMNNKEQNISKYPKALTASTHVLASTTESKVSFQSITINRKRDFSSNTLVQPLLVDNQPQSLQGEAQLKALES